MEFVGWEKSKQADDNRVSLIKLIKDNVFIKYCGWYFFMNIETIIPLKYNFKRGKNK